MLVDRMMEENKRWEEVITTTDLTHKSRKAWKTIKSLSNYPITSTHQCLVNSNQVVHQLLMQLHSSREVTLVYHFSNEYRKKIAALKNGKAAGIDDVLVKQLNNLGPTLHNWLLDMLNKCFTENKVPRL